MHRSQEALPVAPPGDGLHTHKGPRSARRCVLATRPPRTWGGILVATGRRAGLGQPGGATGALKQGLSLALTPSRVVADCVPPTASATGPWVTPPAWKHSCLDDRCVAAPPVAHGLARRRGEGPSVPAAQHNTDLPCLRLRPGQVGESRPTLGHNLYDVEWAEEEQRTLEVRLGWGSPGHHQNSATSHTAGLPRVCACLTQEGLQRYSTARLSSLSLYVKLAALLPLKAVRDVALRVRWMSKRDATLRKPQQRSTKVSARAVCECGGACATGL